MKATPRPVRRVSAFEEGSLSQDEMDFIEFVELAMREKYNLRFRNDNTFHAVRLIHKFFMSAAREMRIFSGELRLRVDNEESPDYGLSIYEDEHLLTVVGMFLYSPNNSLEIVVEREPERGIERHPLVKKIAALKKAGRLHGSCEIAKLPDRPEGAEQKPHMIIMDRTAYRLETDDAEAEATVNVNDSAKAGELIGVFNSLRDEATPLWSVSRDQAAAE